jgi:hypothetical protein
MTQFVFRDERPPHRPCSGFTNVIGGRAMKKEDLKEMASRCRIIARTADEFTKRRLLDLATKYEARLEGRLPPVTKSTSATIKIDPPGSFGAG